MQRAVVKKTRYLSPKKKYTDTNGKIRKTVTAILKRDRLYLMQNRVLPLFESIGCTCCVHLVCVVPTDRWV